MFKIKFLRNIVLASFALAIILPLHNIFISYPSFVTALNDEAEDDSIHIAEHLLSMLRLRKTSADSDSFPIDHETIEAMRKDSNLVKIKIFSSDGNTLYSTDTEDIGKQNNHEYFHSVVGKGLPYSKIVEKQGLSLEGEMMLHDIVETYVPIMKGDTFTGAFEIYHDITTHKERFDRLIFSSSLFSFSLALGLIALVFIAASKAYKTLMGMKTAEENLRTSEEKYRLIFDNSPLGIMHFDNSGQLTTCNQYFADIIGAPIERVTDFNMIKQLKDERMKKAASAALSGKMGHYEGEYLSVTGQKRTPVKVDFAPILSNAGDVMAGIAVWEDITERKRSADLIQEQFGRLNALRSIDRAILASLDLKITLDVFLTQVIAQMGIDAATVLLVNQRTQMLEYGAGNGFRSTALKHTRLKFGDSYAGRAAKERRTITIPDLDENMGGFAASRTFSEEGFVSYVAIPLIAKGQVKGVLELFSRSTGELTPGQTEFLEAIADQGAIALENATMFDELQRSNADLSLAYDATIKGWSQALDLRDKETEGHSQRVTDLTMRIAREFGMDDKAIVHIQRGALLHDIGKMGIPDRILLKPGKLTEEEWIIMKFHPVYARDLLFPIEHLRPAIDIPYYHHEKWDGTGYPEGLKGEQIPLAARIFAVVDVWDALLSDRPYRPAWPKEKVLEHIQQLAGTHFDARVIEVFFSTDL